MTITSPHNQRLKEIRKLRMRRRERDRAGRFVAEGEDLVAAADSAGWPALERYCATGSGLQGVEVEAKALAQASGLASGTRTLAVYEERWISPPLGPLCVYLHGVHDPGNVGALLRSAAAFGASCLVIGPGTADPFSPKAVRGSMGAVFSVALARHEGDVSGLPGTKIALLPGGGLPLSQLGAVLEPPVAGGWQKKVSEPGGGDGHQGVSLLIGSEREGLPEDVVAAADHTAHIPIVIESLNAAMAATVALYELSRMPGA